MPRIMRNRAHGRPVGISPVGGGYGYKLREVLHFDDPPTGPAPTRRHATNAVVITVRNTFITAFHEHEPPAWQTRDPEVRRHGRPHSSPARLGRGASEALALVASEEAPKRPAVQVDAEDDVDQATSTLASEFDASASVSEDRCSGTPRSAITRSEFLQEVLAVAEEVGEVLCRLACAPAVEARIERAIGEEAVVILKAGVQAQSQAWADGIVAAAKETFFSSPYPFRGVCLLGYKKHPFRSTPTGFMARFGSVRRKRQACRQFYGHGKCRYEHHCKWEHPETVCSISFSVEIRA